MIVVTGGAGFIGSALVARLNELGRDDILIVDELGKSEKWKNLVSLKFDDYLDKNDFLESLAEKMYADGEIETIFHMGACSDTQENDADFLMKNNVDYTKMLSEYCLINKIQFVYASSAATYGDGEKGYSDKSIDGLKPMNMYGYSKQLFDVYAEKGGYFDDENCSIIGLKFFNVYGPNEEHKGNMKSMVSKAYKQISDDGKIRLFKSYKPEYPDGGQKRDFIYVKDAVDITLSLAEKGVSGIYNIGTGKAATWNDLARAIFKAMGRDEKIEYIEMPESLKAQYQDFTEATMTKTFSVIGEHKFLSLDDAVADYVQNYLAKKRYLGEK